MRKIFILMCLLLAILSRRMGRAPDSGDRNVGGAEKDGEDGGVGRSDGGSDGGSNVGSNGGSNGGSTGGSNGGSTGAGSNLPNIIHNNNNNNNNNNNHNAGSCAPSNGNNGNVGSSPYPSGNNYIPYPVSTPNLYTNWGYNPYLSNVGWGNTYGWNRRIGYGYSFPGRRWYNPLGRRHWRGVRRI